jgi:hypothetical protein
MSETAARIASDTIKGKLSESDSCGRGDCEEAMECLEQIDGALAKVEAG